MVPAKRREQESALPIDKSPVPVEIGDDSVGMVNHFDDLTCHIGFQGLNFFKLFVA